MKKVPMPVVVALVVVALLVLGYSVTQFTGHSSEVANTASILKDVQNQPPANAPSLPAGINPTEGAVGRGGGSKKH